MPAATPYSSTSLYEKVVNRIETPLIRLFGFASRWLPDATIENTNKHNTHTLILIRDTLLEKWFGKGKEFNQDRAKAIRAMFTFLISKYDRDNNNGGYLDDFFAEFAKHDWINRKTNLDLVSALESKQYDKVMDLIE